MRHKFEKFCKDYENIENYENAAADDFKGWNCHHKKGVEFTQKELISLGMYYNRPAEELIFLTLAEHASLHMKGKLKSAETKKKMSEAQKGHPVSEKTKKKLSEMNKGKWKGENNGMYGKKHSEEARKKLSLTHKGRRWFNNGKISKFCYECPEGFVPGRV